MRNLVIAMFFMGMQQLNAETIMGFSDKGSLNQNQIEIEYDQI